MKKTSMPLVLILFVLGLTATAQEFSPVPGPSNFKSPPVLVAQASPAPTTAPTSPGVVPALPATPPTQGDVITNLLAASGGGAVATFALNLLPGWNKEATNSFNAKELELEVGPTWKSATTSGATPFISIGGNYFFTRNFGLGGDAITFGDGSGGSDLDSAHAFALLRADKGNVAGHIILGGGRDVSLGRYLAEIGGGFEYRYSTGVGILCDTRFVYRFDNKNLRDGDHEFLTRLALTLHF